MNDLAKLALAALAAVLVGASSGSVAERCADDSATASVTAFCGFVAPEDMVSVDDKVLVISSMEPTDFLYGFDLESQSVTRLATRLYEPSPARRWGDPECEMPTTLVSHGLDLSMRDDGERQLLVVNHGDRESIEYFSLSLIADALTLQWRGCVMATDNAQFNDVAGLPDGGFLATDPITASWQLFRMTAASLGAKPGRVYRWHPDRGYREIPNTRSRYPNGILLSADGNSFYLNVYLKGEVREHALEDGRLLRQVKVKKPDNSSLTPEGTLLVASHRANVFTLLRAIASAPEKRNEIAYDIVEIDTDSFTTTTRYRSDGSELGGGTVAQQVGDAMYVGAFRGDRIIRVTEPASP